MNPDRPFTTEELNLLQDQGIISDLVIDDKDIWKEDRERAWTWLREHNPKSFKNP